MSRILEVVKRFNKEVLAILLFGSYVYNSRRFRDIDILVLVDKLRDIHEKINIELETVQELRREVRKPFDIVVLDLDSFKENLVVGSFLSGLVIGYKVIHDTVGIDRMLKEFFKKLARDSYIYVKKRRWNLSAIAKAKLLSKG